MMMEFGKLKKVPGSPLDCDIGDFSTILLLRFTRMPWRLMAIIVIVFVNRLLTPNAPETFPLAPPQLDFGTALSEIERNATHPYGFHGDSDEPGDWTLTGGGKLVWWILPILLPVGFVTPHTCKYRWLRTACP